MKKYLITSLILFTTVMTTNAQESTVQKTYKESSQVQQINQTESTASAKTEKPSIRYIIESGNQPNIKEIHNIDATVPVSDTKEAIGMIIESEQPIQIENGKLISKGETIVMPKKAISAISNDPTLIIKKIALESDQQDKQIYNIEKIEKGKFLGIVTTEVIVEAKVDASTGKLISLKKPWWSFLIFTK